MSKHQLMFIRHSRTVDNAREVMMGARFDSPLTEEGIEIARTKGRELKAMGFIPDRVYCSKLNRSQQTLEIILEELGLNLPITQLSELNERDFGTYEGKPYQLVLDAFAAEGANPDSVETVDHFIERLSVALHQLKSEATHASLIVTHSNPVMALQAMLLEPAILNRFWELGDPAYCQGFTYDYES